MIDAYLTLFGKEILTLSGPPSDIKKYAWPAKLSEAAESQKYLDMEEFEQWFNFD